MIRFLEDKDIQACCDLYNWYIENTTITFEEEALTLSQFTDRVHRIKKSIHTLFWKKILKS